MIQGIKEHIEKKFEDFDENYYQDGSNYKSMIYLIGLSEGLLVGFIIVYIINIFK